MAFDTSPDLARISLIRTAFLDCLITTQSPTLDFEQVVDFANPAVLVQSFFSGEDNEVEFQMHVQVTALNADKQPLPVTGLFRLSFTFLVDNLADLLFLNPEQPKAGEVPNLPLTVALLGVAYSTARGMILSKVEYTALSGFCLPLRSVRQIIADSAVAQKTEAASPPPAAPKPKRAKKTR